MHVLKKNFHNFLGYLALAWNPTDNLTQNIYLFIYLFIYFFFANAICLGLCFTFVRGCLLRGSQDDRLVRTKVSQHSGQHSCLRSSHCFPQSIQANAWWYLLSSFLLNVPDNPLHLIWCYRLYTSELDTASKAVFLLHAGTKGGEDV
jgi:hypothetical protein